MTVFTELVNPNSIAIIIITIYQIPILVVLLVEYLTSTYIGFQTKISQHASLLPVIEHYIRQSIWNSNVSVHKLGYSSMAEIKIMSASKCLYSVPCLHQSCLSLALDRNPPSPNNRLKHIIKYWNTKLFSFTFWIMIGCLPSPSYQQFLFAYCVSKCIEC